MPCCGREKLAGSVSPGISVMGILGRISARKESSWVIGDALYAEASYPYFFVPAFFAAAFSVEAAAAVTFAPSELPAMTSLVIADASGGAPSFSFGVPVYPRR